MATPRTDDGSGASLISGRRALGTFTAIFFVMAGAWLAIWWRELPTLLHWDSLGYYKSAINLLRHGVFSEESAPGLHPISFRTPGYPAFLAAIFFITGPGVFGPMVANVAMLWACGALTLALARQRGVAPRRALDAALLVGLHPMLLFWAVQIYTETLFIFMMMLALWMALKGARWMWFAAALLVGLMPLVRPVGLYLLPIAFAGMAAVMWRREAANKALAIVAGALLIVAPTLGWMGRNHATFGDAYFTEIGAWNLRHAHMNVVLARETGANYGELWADSFKRDYPRMYRPDGSPGALKAEWTRDALVIVRDHPMGTITAALRNLIPLYAPGIADWGKHIGAPYPGVTTLLMKGPLGEPRRTFASLSDGERIGLLIGIIEGALNMAVLGLALWIGARRIARRDYFAAFLMVMVMAMTALSLPTGLMTAPRFRVPIWPLLVLLAVLPMKRETELDAR